MVTNRILPEMNFDGNSLEKGDKNSNWLSSALERINDSDLMNYARSANAQNETLSKRLEESGHLPKVAMEFASRHHSDLDLDGNGYISEKEMDRILESPELSKSLSAVERNVVRVLKDNWKVAAKGSNDEWFQENNGISLKDAQKLDRIDTQVLVHKPENVSFTGTVTNANFRIGKASHFGATHDATEFGSIKKVDYIQPRLRLEADIASATLGAVPRMLRTGIGMAFSPDSVERVSTALGFGTTLDAIGAKYKSMSEVPDSFLKKSIENGASSPLVVSEFLSNRFADFDLDGNNYISKTELKKIRTSDLWSRSLSTFDSKVLDEAQRIGRRINEANDDEFLWEKSGMSKRDLVAFGLTHVKNVDEMPKEPGDYLKMAQVGDDPRQYLIHIPPGYDGTKKVPLMIFLHPFSGSAESAAELTAFNKKADEEGFIAIYPNGRFCKASGVRAWNITDFPNFMSSDTDFVGTIIETAKEGLEIDPSKVFVAGYSNGGMLAQDIATKFSDKVAAIACVSGCMTGLESGPTEDVSVLMIHGGKDKVVPYDGRLKWFNDLGLPAMRSVDYAREFWTTNDNLTQVERRNIKDGVQFERWTNPDKKTELQIYTLDEIKHRYPGGNYEASNAVPETIQATNVIWNFFEQHGKENPATSNKPPAGFQFQFQYQPQDPSLLSV